MERKYAVITGADHGLGLALTKNLLIRGYYVVATRVNPNETLLDELCKANSDNMSVVTMNIGSDESVAAAKHILETVLDKPLPREKAPLYIDYKGDSLPW